MKNRSKYSAISKYVLTPVLVNMLFFACACGVSVAADSEDKVYSGVYKNNYQIIPNTMATLCKISADDIVKDSFKLKDCIDSLIIKRRSSDTGVAKEGLKDLNKIKADEIGEMMSLATIRGAEIADYYTETSQKTDEINADAKTVNDVDGAAINTNQLLATVINSFRDIYVEQLKYLAISNIEDIDKSVLDDIAASRKSYGQENNNKKEKTEDKEKNKGADSTFVEVNTTVAEEVVKEQPTGDDKDSSSR